MALPLPLAVLLTCDLLLGSASGDRQDSRLRITNGCDAEVMWIAHMAAAGVGPDPQNVRIEPRASHNFVVPAGLSGTRYWPKLGCDRHGNECSIGESGGPGETCGLGGCAPPVDTKFEASFGQNGQDWVDISLVDGFTLPFKMEILLEEGQQCGAGDGNKDVTTVVDCSRLSLDECPHDELLGDVTSEVDLKVVHPGRNETVGCYSPCSKFTFRQWSNEFAADRTPWDPEVKDYCCPTPPESPEQCRDGPVPSTKFVRAVHEGCPGVYGYAYDDGMGLIRCPDDAKYHVTFYCPATRASLPMQTRSAVETISVFDSAVNLTATEVAMHDVSECTCQAREEPCDCLHHTQQWVTPKGLGVLVPFLSVALVAISTRTHGPRERENYQGVACSEQPSIVADRQQSRPTAGLWTDITRSSAFADDEASGMLASASPV